MNSPLRAFLVYGMALGMILALVGISYANFRYVENNPTGTHFLPRWLGAKTWIESGKSPYQEQIGLDAQERIYGRPARISAGEDRYLFLYPLTSMLFLAPFALLDFNWALALWMTLLELSLVGVAVVSIRLTRWDIGPIKIFGLVVFCLFWFHSVQTIINGQMAALNALWVVLGLFFIMRKQDVLAGVFFALSTTRPTMVFLIIPFVLWWSFSVHRMELFWSVVLSSGVFLLASLALMPAWPLEWVRQLVEFPQYTASLGSPITIITRSMPGIQNPLNFFFFTLVGVYLLVEWVLVWGKDDRWFLWTAMLTILVSNLAGYRTGTTNYVLFIPVMIIIFQALEQRWRPSGGILVFFLLALLFAGLWLLNFSLSDSIREAAGMALPVPFLCLLGLWWIRWWYVRPPRVLLDEITRIAPDR